MPGPDTTTSEAAPHAATREASAPDPVARRSEPPAAPGDAAGTGDPGGPAASAAPADPAGAGDPADPAAPDHLAAPADSADPANSADPGGAGRGRAVRVRLGGVLRGWGRYVRRSAAPVALAVVLAVSGGLLYTAQADKDPAASGNHALTDAAATAQVTGDVSDALSRIFAYTPDDTASTAQAARDLLGGTAAAQYQALFTRIRQQVADQRLTLTTRVVRAGVESLTGDRARLLVFLDQTAQRAGAPATTAAAQLAVTARLQDGRWRITDLKAR